MIVAADVIDLVLAASPSFAESWDKDENVDEAGRLPYIDMADLARHLERQLDAGDTTEFPAVFELIERLHVEGDHWVRELATVGILEALNPDKRFIPWLGPASISWWQRLDRFWGGDPGALNDDSPVPS